jgi:hypothetical protein
MKRVHGHQAQEQHQHPTHLHGHEHNHHMHSAQHPTIVVTNPVQPTVVVTTRGPHCHPHPNGFFTNPSQIVVYPPQHQHTHQHSDKPTHYHP